MAGRKDWWPVLHFTSFHARKDLEENPELMEVKASLTKILCPGKLVSSACALNHLFASKVPGFHKNSATIYLCRYCTSVLNLLWVTPNQIGCSSCRKYDLYWGGFRKQNKKFHISFLCTENWMFDFIIMFLLADLMLKYTAVGVTSGQ